MDGQQDEAVAAMVAVSGCTPEQAQFLLEANAGDQQAALSMYYGEPPHILPLGSGTTSTFRAFSPSWGAGGSAPPPNRALLLALTESARITKETGHNPLHLTPFEHIPSSAWAVPLPHSCHSKQKVL